MPRSQATGQPSSRSIDPPLALVVMGVTGCGKTEISQAVAQKLGIRHIEADQYHPPENIAKMHAGTPLDDADRAGWLDTLARLMAEARTANEGFVLSCSALKRIYRDRLRAAADGLRFAHLDIPREVAMARVSARPGHFMPASLVDSQFATLEPPAGEPLVLTVDASQPQDRVAADICDWIRATAPHAPHD
jgi:gluconokinase